ncbi:MAG: two-component regulator propeller domain-containing protein, partial [Bacteroidota bacterium]|nr:two-component regulator propeller domain-containing protein [Bacteroidota bacterium]
MKRFLLFPLLIALCNLLFGQVVTENYTTLNTGSNGLLESHIYSFAYGPDGKVWIATRDGFSFYDGNSWDYMDYEDFYPGIHGWLRLFTDSNGNLWIKNMININIPLLYYNGDSIIGYGPADGYVGESYESNIIEDNEGGIYILQQFTLLKFQNDTFYNINLPNVSPLPKRNIAQDAWGKIIISYGYETFRQGPEGWDELFHHSSDRILSTSDSITWLSSGSWYNLFYGDSLIEEIEITNLPNNGAGTMNQYYSNFLEDNQGNIWSHPRGKKGLLKFNGLGYTYYNSDSVGFFSDIFDDELILDNGNLWFASWVGGIEEWDGNQFNHINTFDGLVQNSVKIILATSNTIYFGTQNGCSMLKDNIWQSFKYRVDGVSELIINDIFDLGNEKILFATGNHGLVIKDTSQYSGYNYLEGYLVPVASCARKTQEGFNNDFWFAHNNGFAHYFGDSVHWSSTTYWENFTVANGLPSDTVYDLAKDNNGNIWLATENGAASFQNNIFTCYSTSQGLINNQTRSIYVDSDGNIWVGTIAGLSKYDGVSWQNFTQLNGLAGNMVNDIFEDSQGNMWFGTEQGLSKFSNQNFTNYSTAD